MISPLKEVDCPNIIIHNKQSISFICLQKKKKTSFMSNDVTKQPLVGKKIGRWSFIVRALLI